MMISHKAYTSNEIRNYSIKRSRYIAFGRCLKYILTTSYAGIESAIELK